jgi:hypothetical protein
MVEIVSWIGVAFIALFAVVGFTGVVATSVLTAVRTLRPRVAAERIEVREQIAA